MSPSPIGPVMISSWNGVPAVTRAAALLASGTDVLDAMVAGIALVEDDPDELSVGYGGLPNEDGVVELDAAVMDGRRHRAGGVAGVRGFRHVAKLALEVLRRTDHTLLVGEGASKFARALGFPEENLLTEKARKAWLDWKASLSTKDGWLSPEELEGAAGSGFGHSLWAGNTDPTKNQAVNQAAAPAPGDGKTASKVPFTYGTIHLSALTAAGDLASVTSTSGLSYKIAGRVGDSPIVGAGLYTDNAVGSAGATGRGEATLQACAAHSVVLHMDRGDTPEEACLRVLRSIADRTREKRLLDARGRPVFNVTMYAVRKDGLTGSASMHEGYEHVVWSGGKAEVRKSGWLYEKVDRSSS
ncbi:MAG: N(4)-(beta-N-acetylglucosaminyl)-L-asparaginase [Tepidisphaera sp.]